MSLQNLPISRQLMLACGLPLCLVALVFVAILHLFQLHNDDITRLGEAADGVRKSEVDFKIQVQEWKNTLLRGQSLKDFEKYRKQFYDKSRLIQKEMQGLKSALSDYPEIIAKMDSFLETHADLEKQYMTGLRLYDNKNFNSAQLVDRAVRGIDRAPTKAMDEVVQDVLRAREDSQRRGTRNLNTAALAGLAGALLLGALTAFFVTRGLRGSLHQLSTRMAEIASGKGDLRARLEISSANEIGHTAEHFNEFMGSLRTQVALLQKYADSLRVSGSELREVARSISSGSQNTAAGSEEVNATMEELSAGMEQTARTVEHQHGRMRSLASDLETLTTNTNEMESAIQSTAQLSSQVSEQAARAGESLRLMGGSMSKITDSSAKITGIMDIIRSISDRINLLALNAAIESARAGEFGRGFAVVADEVSRLADETSRSLGEIDSLFKSNSVEISAGMQASNQALDITGKIIAGINETTTRLGEILRQAGAAASSQRKLRDETNDIMRQSGTLNETISEQKLGIHEVTRAISDINDAAQNGASASIRLAERSDQLSEVTEMLTGVAGAYQV